MKLAFHVDSIADARTIAGKHGGALHEPSRKFSTNDRTLCDGHDPDGNVIQVWQARD